MLFEKEFAPEKTADEIYDGAKDAREIEESGYIREILEGVGAHRGELDELLDIHAHGWKRNRISNVARAVILLASYEMLYMPTVPTRVSLNEAIELVKTYGEDNAKGFVNGILNTLAKRAKENRPDEA